VNASVFIQFCMDKGPADGNVHNGALVVLMDQLHMNDSGKMMAPANSNAVKRHFWETVGESNCKTTEIKGPGRTDPLLKLRCRCPLMMTQNAAVASGQANGSWVLLGQVSVKRGEVLFVMRLVNGVKTRAFFALQGEESCGEA